MQRRDFLKLAAAAPLLGVSARGRAAAMPAEAGWRTFELSYEVDLSAHAGDVRLWLPVPDDLGDYQRVHALRWEAPGTSAALRRDPVYGAPMLAAQWGGEAQARQVRVVAQVATRDRSRGSPAQILRDAEAAARYLQPTAHMPVDGIVAETARRIVAGHVSPDDQARAIYDWVVDNTFRDPKVVGCGMGDIKAMLETGNLGGKCADINSLFVGLCRAAGIPAREVYGLRVAESAQLKCLGKAGDVSKAQHCRAEYFSPRYGWVPVDPADVRKAVLEAKLAPNDPQFTALRERLFGYWEMNWVGFNHARDFALVPDARAPLPYLMYPYAEVAGGRLDGRDPAAFRYGLNSRALAG